jgi:hypothetical protein
VIDTFEEFVFSFNNIASSDYGQFYEPDFRDLFSIYRKVIDNRVVAIIEYGSGYSTLAMALAMKYNYDVLKPEVDSLRHPNPFQILSIDSSDYYQKVALDRIPADLKKFIKPIRSDSRVTTFAGQICHIFDYIPEFTADFVYLDGPDSDQVLGEFNGFHFNWGSDGYAYGLPMSADLLHLEPFFWPGCVIVVDGRGANARFLKNNFRRNWSYEYNEELDQHFFKLQETAWGPISKKFMVIKGV